jgi:hypothetical protein
MIISIHTLKHRITKYVSYVSKRCFICFNGMFHLSVSHVWVIMFHVYVSYVSRECFTCMFHLYEWMMLMLMQCKCKSASLTPRMLHTQSFGDWWWTSFFDDKCRRLASPFKEREEPFWIAFMDKSSAFWRIRMWRLQLSSSTVV